MTDMIKAPQKGAFFCWMQVVYCYTPIVAVPAPVIEFMPPHRVILSKAKDLKSASWCIQILHSVQNDNKRTIKEQ